MIIDFFRKLKPIPRGEWIPEEGAYENLGRGQWKSLWKCRMFGHNFKDPRILYTGEPQTMEKCTRCSLERDL